ncbi:MAG: hypothetical protein CL610_28975 [Anaerolineaceae bacterium]|nr:hypothetical protein [Anaerolineaceae bacterium]
MTQPMTLPETFNPETFLVSKTTENGLFHESRAGARLAEQLVANGTAEDLALAENVLDATLRCQELNADDPHYGNFYWMAEDDVVADLNAVEFNLERLIPMMLQHADRLPAATQTRVLEAIRLGLDEIRSLDVHVAYSNIALLDILNSCLGGELLGDTDIAQRGYDKLVRWMAFTDQSGVPREYNSPTYTKVVIRALKVITDLCQHEPTRIRARTMIARMAVSVGLHIHRGTGRWAGPHARAYHPSVVCETPPEVEIYQDWLADGTLPAWAADLLQAPPEPYEVIETASAQEGLGLTTYHSPSFSVGTASEGYGGQANVLMAHYVREGADRPGVLYTRYVMDEKWLGDFYHATDRTKSRNLIEEGRFFGVQQGPRVIALYAPQNMGQCHSAKATFIFTQRQHVDEIWVGDQRVESLPYDIPPGELVVIGSGSALIAVQPLSRTDAGRNAPLRLVEKEGDLVLEIYNYKGSEKAFWEMRPGLNPFFKGHPHCGVYLELAERNAYADGRAFAQVVAGGILQDDTDAPFVNDGIRERRWTVSYSRDGQTLGIEIDLMTWRLKQRWTQAGEQGWPMLEAPTARQNRTGIVSVDEATLRCGEAAGWVYANPDAGRWVAGYHGPNPAPLHLTVPGGSVQIESLSTGTVVWDNGVVTVDALDMAGTPQVNGGRLQAQ